MTTTLAPVIPAKLAEVAKANGIALDDPLINVLAAVEERASNLLTESGKITVTDATQTAAMAAARAYRLKLKELRVGTENARKKYKAEFLARGRAVDDLANWVKGLIEPEELRLDEAEHFAERQEQQRKATLQAARAEELMAIGVDIAPYNLGEMGEEAYKKLARDSYIALEQKQEAEAKAKREAAEAEARRQEEVKRIRDENERLRQEQIAQQAEMQKERDRLAAEAAAERAKANQRAAEACAAADRLLREAGEKSRVEREARRKAEAELQARRDAEAAAAAQKAKEEKKAARAPDKTKLIAYAKALADVPAPEVSSPEAQASLYDAKTRLAALLKIFANSIQGL